MGCGRKVGERDSGLEFAGLLGEKILVEAVRLNK